jgi:hypothetical protein
MQTYIHMIHMHIHIHAIYTRLHIPGVTIRLDPAQPNVLKTVQQEKLQQDSGQMLAGNPSDPQSLLAGRLDCGDPAKEKNGGRKSAMRALDGSKVPKKFAGDV